MRTAPEIMRELIELAEARRLRPVVGGTYAFVEAAAAHAAIEARKPIGKGGAKNRLLQQVASSLANAGRTLLRQASADCAQVAPKVHALRLGRSFSSAGPAQLIRMRFSSSRCTSWPKPTESCPSTDCRQDRVFPSSGTPLNLVVEDIKLLQVIDRLSSGESCPLIDSPTSRVTRGEHSQLCGIFAQTLVPDPQIREAILEGARTSLPSASRLPGNSSGISPSTRPLSRGSSTQQARDG